MANKDRRKEDTMSATQLDTFQYVGQETGKQGGGSRSEVGEKKKRSMSIEDESNISAAAGNKNGICDVDEGRLA